MAFTRAPGYTNLPNGNFTPVIYSKKVLKFFRKSSVVEDITNTDFAGEIANFGDTVKIIKEPTITVSDYQRGSVLTSQDLVDDEITLVVDKAKAFQFKVDDIESRQSHINWEDLAVSSAAYSLKDSFDLAIFTYMVGEVDAANIYGTVGAPIDTGFGASEVDPVNVLARLSRLLDDVNVPRENRWAVARPQFFEELAQSSSKVMDAQVTGDGDSQLRNGLWASRPVHGFKLYISNNMPVPTGGTATHQILAGHMSSTATAAQIAKTESFRDTTSFADVVRGLHLYGRKVLRPTALAKAFLLIDA